MAATHEKLARALDLGLIEPLNVSIKNWELVRKEYIADGMKKQLALQDAYTLLKKAKTEYDEYQKARA